MKKLMSFVFMALLVSGFHAAEKKTEIIIAAASSLTDAMNELIILYSGEAQNITVTPTYGSSGSLQMQIEQGAPVDIFFSASPKQMTALMEKGLILEGSKKDMLENRIVLVTSKSKTGITSFEDAGTGKITEIAVGEPKSVPAGQYAEQVFTTMGIWEKVKAKAIYAKDVRQVLTYVESGEVDSGVVYATDAVVAKNVRIAATSPKGSHSPVIYPAAIIKASAHPVEAAAFLAWLSGPKAAEVFSRYGFLIP